MHVWRLPEIGVPPNQSKSSMFIRFSIIYKPSISGYPHLRKPPYVWNHPPVRATVFASVCSFVKRFCGHPCGWPPHHLDWAMPTGVANTALCIAGSWQCDGFYVGFLQKLTFLCNKHELKCCLCVLSTDLSRLPPAKRFHIYSVWLFRTFSVTTVILIAYIYHLGKLPSFSNPKSAEINPNHHLYHGRVWSQHNSPSFIGFARKWCTCNYDVVPTVSPS
jgi:hypothetical protein